MYLTNCGSENFDFIILLIGSAGVMLTQQRYEEITFSQVGEGAQHFILVVQNCKK